MESSETSLQSPLGLTVDASSALRLDDSLRADLCAMAVSCRVLRLSMEAQFCAACLLTRYYVHRMNHNRGFYRGLSGTDASFPDREDSQEVLGACLFLGAKVSEEYRRVRDVINCISMLEYKTSVASSECNTSMCPIADGPSCRTAPQALSWKQQPPPLDDAYWDLKKKIVKVEQHVLRWIGFDTFVPSPHRAVVIVVNHLRPTTGACDEHHQESTESEHQALIRESWKLMNNAMFSSFCLSHSVMALACAAVDIALGMLPSRGLIDIPVAVFEVTTAEMNAARMSLEQIKYELMMIHS